jgi:colanic acid biosynthesis glycosyl transferase WcaI
MRILILTQWFHPEPVMKGITLARALRDLGHEVEVLTGFPNYPTGKLYHGYRFSPCQIEEIDGIRVVRVLLFPSHDTSALKRLLTHGSFAISALFLGGFLTRKPDVIYTYDTPMTAGVVSIILGFFKRAPMVFDLQDLWPDTIFASGMIKNQGVINSLQAVCRWVFKRAAHVVVLSPGFAKKLEERGIPKDHISVIYNWCDETEIKLEEDADTALEMGADGRFNVVFAGSMGPAQGLVTVIRAAKMVELQNPRVQFVFVGSGTELESLKQLVLQMGLGNVRFLPRRPMAQIGRVFQYADVLLVHLKDEALFAVTVPSKTQAYLSVGRPILMAVAGDAAELIRSAGAGVSCAPENAQELAKTVLEMAAMPVPELQALGRNGQAFYQTSLSLRVGAQKFEEVFQRVVQRFGRQA